MLSALFLKQTHSKTNRNGCWWKEKQNKQKKKKKNGIRKYKKTSKENVQRVFVLLLECLRGPLFNQVTEYVCVCVNKIKIYEWMNVLCIWLTSAIGGPIQKFIDIQ